MQSSFFFSLLMWASITVHTYLFFRYGKYNGWLAFIAIASGIVGFFLFNSGGK